MSKSIPISWIRVTGQLIQGPPQSPYYDIINNIVIARFAKCLEFNQPRSLKLMKTAYQRNDTSSNMICTTQNKIGNTK